MAKLKVVHICDKCGVRGSTTHGVSRLFAILFPKYDTSKFDIKLYAVKHPDSASQALEADGIPISYMGKSAANPATLASFINVIMKERADVLHLHGWIAANYGRVAGRLTGVPTIMHEHGVDPVFPRSQRIADSVLSPFTHTAVAVSNSVKDFLIKYRSVRPERIKVVYHGVPLDEFGPADPTLVAQTRAELGIPDGCPVIGTIGRIDTQKGITYLIKAARQVIEFIPQAHFLIVGDGPKKEELEQEAKSLGIYSNVKFAGHRSDIPVIQSMLDIQAFPSLWEGTPLTVYEAMAMGLPIVSTDVDGLGEVLVGGENALIVKPADPTRLAGGIVRVLNNKELSDKLRAGSRENSKRFDIAQTALNLESIYEELCPCSRNV